jgi:hypothetical protein
MFGAHIGTIHPNDETNAESEREGRIEKVEA